MLEYTHQVKQWLKDGKRIVLARVLQTWGSSPRPVGSVMLINEDGAMLGSVSGGCVEGDVVKQALEVLETHQARQVSYGISNEDAWTVGLSCGGQLSVELREVDTSLVWIDLFKCLENNKYSVLISSIDKEGELALKTEKGYSGDPLPEDIKAQVDLAYDSRRHAVVDSGGHTYFIQVFPRKSLLLVIGVAHITTELVKLAKWQDFEVVVIDPRGFFATNTVFEVPPDRVIESYPSEVLCQYPLDAYTYAAILSHDPKIDDDALDVLLKHDVAYIGALGSKKNHVKRVERLKDRGFSETQIAAIHAPIGVNIAAKGAREIALSIMAEIISVKNQPVRIEN